MFPVRFPARRAIPAAFAAAGVVALASLTACGSSASSTPAASGTSAGASTSAAGTSTGASPAGSGSAIASASSAAGTSSAAAGSPSAASTATVTGTAASALAAKAFTNTQNAASVRVAGSAVNGSQRVTFDLTLVKSAGCTGTIALSKTQTFKIVATQGYVWLLPTKAFLQGLKPTPSKAVLALVQDKYIKVKSTDKQISGLTSICTFSGLFGSAPKPSGTAFKAAPTNYNGQAAYLVTQAGKQGSAYISNSATSVLLRLTDPSANGGTILFSNYDGTQAITPPSAAESIDGTQLGI
jgi:hypothetical protein